MSGLAREYHNEKIAGPYYVPDRRSWALQWDRLAVTEGAVGTTCLERAVVLPPRPLKIEGAEREHAFEGGVVGADGSFSAGHVRDASRTVGLSCVRPAAVDEGQAVFRDEDVLFGGFVFDHFGHQLLDSTARLWYAVEHPEDTRPLVFLRMPGVTLASSDFQRILDMLGIAPARVEYVDRPTRFARITVPDQAFVAYSSADARFLSVFRAMKERASGPAYSKVYLSKGRFARHDYVNERFLEDFHRARGFEVVYPETLTLGEQVAIVGHAQELATTMGTMSHLFLFAEPDARMTVYQRSTSCVTPQLLLDKVAGHHAAYVYAARNPLPTSHVTGAHLFGPTRYFRAYLRDEGISCTEEELRSYEPTGEDLRDYLLRYDEVSQEPRAQRRAAGWDMSHVLAALHDGMTDTLAFKEDFETASIAKARGLGAAAAAPEPEEPTAPVASFKLSGCSCEGAGDAVRLRFHSSLAAAGEQADYGIVMVAHEGHASRDVKQGPAVVEGETVTVTLDLRDFLKGLEGERTCRRWDVFVSAPGVFQPLRGERGTRPSTNFLDCLLMEEGRLLVPHLSDGDALCFWHLGAHDPSFSQEFYRYRPDRPLANNLLVLMVKAGRWDDVEALYRDFRAGKLRCEPQGGGKVAYRGESYAVGQFAYQQAELRKTRASEGARRGGRSVVARLARRLRAVLRRLLP